MKRALVHLGAIASIYAAVLLTVMALNKVCCNIERIDRPSQHIMHCYQISDSLLCWLLYSPLIIERHLFHSDTFSLWLGDYFFWVGVAFSTITIYLFIRLMGWVGKTFRNTQRDHTD